MFCAKVWVVLNENISIHVHWLSILMYCLRKVTLQSSLYVMPGSASEVDWVLCQWPRQRGPSLWLLSLPYFLNRSRKIPLVEFPSCEIHSVKQSLPLLALAGVLLLCLIRTRIAWLLLKAAIIWGTGLDLNPLPFIGQKKELPFHLLAQDKGLSPFPEAWVPGRTLPLT